MVEPENKMDIDNCGANQENNVQAQEKKINIMGK